MLLFLSKTACFGLFLRNNHGFSAWKLSFCNLSAVFLLAILFVTFGLPASFCQAGASASSWVVVVNGDSVNSRTLANHYCEARNIPLQNVIVLSKIPAVDRISGDQFRDLILQPVLAEIQNRGLAAHVQGIAYSADFPTTVDFKPDTANFKEQPEYAEYMFPVGSISGLTYLFRFVLSKAPEILAIDSNLYAARPATQLLVPVFTAPEQRTQLDALLKDSKHQEAAELLDTMCRALDKDLLYPMLYQSAQQWALAENKETALKRLEQSIRGGWSYREYLLKDRAFEKLLDDKDFQRISKRCPEQSFEYLPTRGFDARTFYSGNTLGCKNQQFGVSYMMSMMLGVTRDLGTTQDEAIANLKTSIKADYSYPEGSFVYTKTGDVRTTTRLPSFSMAIDRLKSKGFNAFILEAPLPAAGEKCSGVMFGIADFDWQQNGATLLPGAIADNLTSYGCVMTVKSQTKATELLRFGAAATSGSVVEPYAIQNKFPHPMIHVHYTDGLTAAEAFYSSITCPYQMLLVGDPLCQPYCKPPRFAIKPEAKSVGEKQPFRMLLELDKSEKTTEPDSLQWMFDGVVKKESTFESKVEIQIDKVNSGAHEIRFIAKTEKPLELRYEQSFWVSAGPAELHLRLTGPKEWKAVDDKPLTLTIDKPAPADGVTVFHDSEAIGTIANGETTLEVLPSKVGYGPVRFQASKQGANGRPIRSLPLTVEVAL